MVKTSPLMIFRGAEVSTQAPRRRKEELFDPRVIVNFNPKGYANSAIMMFWFEYMLLPALGSRPTLLVMDLFRSHSTQEIKDWLQASHEQYPEEMEPTPDKRPSPDLTPPPEPVLPTHQDCEGNCMERVPGRCQEQRHLHGFAVHQT